MALSDVSCPPSLPPERGRKVRRRWYVLLLTVGLLLAGGLAAAEGWAAWQEHCARQALAQERLDDAQRHIDRALSLRSRRLSTNVLAARIARLRGAYSEAENYLNRCGQLGDMTEEVHLEWLLLRCQRGAVEELAPNLLALVADNHPESAAILEALAAVYMRQTRYPAALRCLDQWLEREPDSVRAFDWRGWVYNQLDRRSQAVSDCQRALELQPGRAIVRLRLAQILVETSRHPEAVPHLEQLRRELPDNPDVAVALASCRVVQSRTEEALVLLDAVLKDHPDHFDALVQRGKLERMLGHGAEAEPWFRKALDLKPHDPEAQLRPVPKSARPARSTRRGRAHARTLGASEQNAISVGPVIAQRSGRSA